MVADRVVLVTRRAGEETATRWESTGDGRYSLAPGERAGHGTTVTLHLKPADEEEGLADFTDEWVLKRIVKRYSDFVIYPIRLEVEREESATDGEAQPKEGETRKRREDLTLNSMKPIWARPAAEVGEEEYAEFYKHIAHDWNPPLAHVTLKAEGRFEYQALMFIPGEAPYDLYYLAFEPGLQLYVRRVMIMEHCAELLPRYLRFLKGVVEAPDLPLNVSREILQSNRQIVAIRGGLARKVLDTLKTMKEEENEKYLRFWEHYGRAMKEGVGGEQEYRDRLLELLLFQSSHDPARLTTLADYVGRMKEGQKEIFYLTGESRSAVENSPHLEVFRERGIEVLYLTDPVDELMVQTLPEVLGKRLKSVGKGTVELPEEGDDKEEREKARRAREGAWGPARGGPEAARRARQAGPAVDPAHHLAGLSGGGRARLQPTARKAADEGKGGRPQAAPHPRAQPRPRDRHPAGGALREGRRRPAGGRLRRADLRLRHPGGGLRAARPGPLQPPAGRADGARRVEAPTRLGGGSEARNPAH